MGLMDKFDELKDKAKEMLGDNKDKVSEGIDKAGDLVDEKTGGKFSEQVDKGQETAKDAINKMGGASGA